MTLPHNFIPLALGIIGTIMSIISNCSSIPTFLRIIKKKSVEDFSEHPYVISLLTAILWSFYGLLTLKHGGLMMLIVNAIGWTFQYVYLALYMAFSTPHKRMTVGMLIGAVHLASVGVVLVVNFLLKQASIQLHVMGVISCMAAIIMFASPLSIMGLVVRTKSVEYMPFLLSFFLTLRSGTWCAYGYVIQDIFIEITNTFGVSLGVAQLVLYLIYCKKPLLKKTTLLIHGVNVFDLKLTQGLPSTNNQIVSKRMLHNNSLQHECNEDKSLIKV